VSESDRIGGRGPMRSRGEQGLGEQLRQLRAERNLSVRTLAARSGFSPSFVSQVELNHASPSISSLERLAAALGVTLGEFFADGTATLATVTRSGRRRPLTSWWSRARIEALTPTRAGWPFEAVMITIAAGGSSGKHPHGQPAHQLVTVLAGDVRLTLGSAVQMLRPGDAVSLEPHVLRRWDNAGKTSARLIVVSSRRAH
jgi:XRE family transcriptional regulator, regulator of sulfur utilization